MAAPTLKSSPPLQVAVVTTAEANARMQEWVRASITGSFLVLLVAVVVWACIESRSWEQHWYQTKELLQIVLPAITGLLGSSLGFYFGKTSQTTPPEAAPEVQ